MDFEDTFYYKRKKEKGELPSQFQYDSIPDKLKNSIFNAFKNSFPISSNIYDTTIGYIMIKEIRDYLTELWGQDCLYDSSNVENDFKKGFLNEKDIGRFMTYVQLICHKVEHKNTDLIERINWHIQNNGVGYKYQDGEIIKIEDEIYFENVTSPVLSILSKKGYEDTKKEYLKSYEKLKNGQYQEAVIACTKALETIIKTRLNTFGIIKNLDVPIKQLLGILIKKIQIPEYMNKYIDSLGEIINGIATVRNKDSAHGKREGDNSNLDEVFVRYIINQTASSILFVAECKFINE